MATKNTTQKSGLVPAAGYVRMSSGTQKDSPAKQRRAIEELARREGFYIVKWYDDHAITGTKSKNRAAFQQMLNDSHKGIFKAVLLWEQTRLSRERVLTQMSHFQKIVDEADCEVWTTVRGKLDFETLGGAVMVMADAFQGRDESKTVSRRSVEGKQNKMANGQRIGGKPFGFDREFLDEHGKVVQVVSFRDHFCKPPQWQERLTPSREREAVEAVKFMFAKTLAGWSMNSIAKELNRKGLVGGKGGRWTGSHVVRIVQNPACCGDTAYGRHVRGDHEFNSLLNGGEVVIRQDTHKGIVDRKTFDRAQAVLAMRPKRYGKRKTEKFLLTGLLRCGCCGYALSGRNDNRKNVKAYRCQANSTFGIKCCEHPTNLSVQSLHKVVFGRLSELHKLTTDDLERAAMRRVMPSSTDDQLEQSLAEIRARIAKAKKNLPLADSPEDFRTISDAIAEWQTEEKGILAKLAEMNQGRELAPEVSKLLEKLPFVRDHIEQADARALAQALAVTIKTIHVNRERVDDGRRGRVWGTIVFRPHMGIESLSFDVGDVGQREWWQDVRDYLVEHSPRPVRVVELVDKFCQGRTKKAHTIISQKLLMMRSKGLVENIPGRNGGWLATKVAIKSARDTAKRSATPAIAS